MTSPRDGAIVVLLLGVLARLLLIDHGPALYLDSGTYLTAARDFISGEAWVGQARRTPGYPMLVALAGESPQVLLTLQAVMGLATSLLVYWMAWRLCGKPVWAVVAATAHAVSLQQVYQEAALLTEAASAFATAATLALFILAAYWVRQGRQPSAALCTLGVLAAWALFVRPQFVLFIPMLPTLMLWVTWRAGGGFARAASNAGMVAVPAVALVLAWCAVVQAKTGYFTLSTQSGFGMVNHPIDYIELAPPQYAPARDVLIKVRDERIAQVGHSRNTIWYAWPEIQRVTGWTLPEASRHLQAMCRQMFIEHPWRYARSVASAWIDFWTVPFFWKPEQVNPTVRGAIEGIWWVQHKLLRLANLAFVLTVAAVCVWPALRRRVRWDLGLTAISATILMSSLIQALADQGASSRYHLPTQSLVVLVLVVVAARWWASRSTSTAASNSIRSAA